MSTKTVTHEWTPEEGADTNKVSVTIGSATARMRMKRDRLIMAASESKNEDPDLFILQAWAYPRCLGCLVSAEGISPNIFFVDFAELPDEFTTAWIDAASELNPHWFRSAGDNPDPK